MGKKVGNAAAERFKAIRGELQLSQYNKKLVWPHFLSRFGALFWSLGFWSFEFVSDFGFRFYWPGTFFYPLRTFRRAGPRLRALVF
jgi:hypothetical protein